MHILLSGNTMLCKSINKKPQKYFKYNSHDFLLKKAKTSFTDRNPYLWVLNIRVTPATDKKKKKMKIAIKNINLVFLTLVRLIMTNSC